MRVAWQNPIRFISAVLLLVGHIVVFGACLPEGPVFEEDKTPKGKEGTGVLAVMASIKEIPLIHKAQGVIVPANRLEIKSPFNGMIAKVSVHEGQRITAGTQLMVFDDELAKAKLELSNAEAEEAEVAIDYDQYRFDNRDALLEDEEINQTVFELIEKKLEYEKARLKRAKAETEYLQKVSRKSDITSSIAGVVTSSGVTDQMQVAEGQFLMEIVQDDPVKLKVSLPEEFIPATYKGQLLQLQYPDIPELKTAKISDLGLAIDPFTGTFDVFAKLNNPEGKFKTGMQIPTTLATDKKISILSIPKSSVTLRNKKAVVFRVEKGVAKRVSVRLGRTNGEEVAVEKGIADGDIIVMFPSKGLKDGDKVRILTTAAEKKE
jgi:RND family efflux transporter MFP subunit